MPLPPKGDPRRPLHLAVRSARVLGVMFLLFGLCGVAPVLMRVTPVGTALTGVLVLVASLMYFGPAACYLVFASYLAGYRRWAVTATLVVASVNAVAVLIIICGVAIAITGAPAFEWPMAAVIGVFLLFLLGLGEMIYHLIRSYEAVKLPPFGRPDVQGFAPILPIPAEPVGNGSPVPPHPPSGP